MGSVRQQVRDILKNKPSFDGTHFSYYVPINDKDPKELKDGRSKKYSYRSEKLAADMVSYLNLDDILSYLNEFLAEFTQILSSSSDKRAVNFLNLFTTFKANLESEEAKKSHFKSVLFKSDLTDFSDEWKQLHEALKLVIAHPKDLKIPTDKRELGLELQTWIEGIYSHACVYKRILELEAILEAGKNNNITKSPHPLKTEKINFDTKNLPSVKPNVVVDLPDAEVKAIEAMAKLDGKESLPILLMLLSELKKLAQIKEKNKEADKMTVESLEFALKVLGEVNIVQNQGVALEAITFARSISTKLIPDTIKIVQKIEKLPMFEDAMHYSHLSVILMESMYLRSHRLSEKDPENTQFYQGSGLYKSAVGVYYLYAAHHIRQKLALLENKKEEVKTDTLIPTHNLQMFPAKQNSSGKSFFLVNKRDTKESKLMCWRNLLLADDFQFSPEEEKIFSSLSMNIIAIRGPYLKSTSYVRYGFQMLFGSYAEKVHLADLDNFIKVFLDPGAKPLDILRGLLALYDKVLSEQSDALAPLILNVFSSSYDVYHGHLYPQEERMQQAKR